MFGAQKTTFGAGSFGQTGGAFGSSGTTFGGANTSFGGGTTFGAQTPAASGGLFGTNTSTTTQSTGGLFGGNTSFTGGLGTQATPQATGLFGAAGQSSSVFATPTTSAGSTFGAKTPGGFGAAGQQSTGLFGSNTQTASTGLFGGGGSTVATVTPFGSTGGFGATSAIGATGGTTVQFNPPMGNDTMMKGGASTTISTRHMCITAMKEYETKCFEELRMDDYTAGRKGAQQKAGGLFGSTQTTQSSGGLFGATQTTKPAAFTGFGAATSTPATGGLFGQAQPQQQQATGLFGGANKTSLFGATPTTSAPAAFAGFGNQASTSLFGQANQQKPSVFGATATSQPSGGLFSTTQTSTAGFGGFNTTGFGQTSQANTSIFNKPTAFGQPTSSAAAPGFGQASTGGLFGSKPATAGTSFGGFGQTNAAGFGGNLFGNKPAGFGTGTSALGAGFGANTSLGGTLGAGTGTSFGFNTNKPTTGTLGAGFGGTTGFTGFGNTGASTGLALGANPSAPAAGNDGVAAQQAQVQQMLAALSNAPYGDSPLFRNLKADTPKREELLKPTNPAAQRDALKSSQYKVSPRPTTKIKPKPLHSIVNGKNQLFEGLEDEDSSFGNDTFVPRRSIKRLVLKGGRLSSSGLSQGSLSQSHSRLDEDNDLVPPSPIVDPAGVEHRPGRHGDLGLPSQEPLQRTSTEKRLQEPPISNLGMGMGRGRSLDDTLAELQVHPNRLTARQIDSSQEISHVDSSGEQDRDGESDRSMTPPPCVAGIILTRPQYFIMPSFDELSDMIDDNGDCWVENFVIGREGYGNVLFPGMTNVAGLNLDDIVHFRRKEITIYPDDENKPEEGEGLNKRAQVTLDCVWPLDKTSHSPIKSPNRLGELDYQTKLEKASAKIGAKFIDYRPETGSWVFEVKHFSKYGLLEDSDDEDTDPKSLELLKQKQKQQLAVQTQKIKIFEQQQRQQQQQQQLQQQQQQHRQMAMDEEDEDNVSMELTQPQPSYIFQSQQTSRFSQQPRSRMTEDDMDMPEDVQQGALVRPGQLPEEEEQGSEVSGLPSSHRLATSLGVAAHDLQLKKASFFGDDEIQDIEPAAFQKAPPALQKAVASASLLEPSVTFLSRKDESWSMDTSVWATSTTSMMPKSTAGLARQDIFQRGSFFAPKQDFDTGLEPTPFSKPLGKEPQPAFPSDMPKERPRHVLSSCIRKTPLALKESVMCDKHGLIMDMGLFKSRSFRVGWGPHWSLTTQAFDSGITEGPGGVMSSRPSLKRSPYHVVIQGVQLDEAASQHTLSLTEQWLEVQLGNSETETENTCPLFVPRPGVDALHQYSLLTQQHQENVGSEGRDASVEQAGLVWDLTVALWGKLQHLETSELDTYSEQHARRETVSQWLSAAAEKYITAELEEQKSKGMDGVYSVLSQLSGCNIAQACLEAQQNGEHRLALLVAQAAGSETSKLLLRKQLDDWHQHHADQFISPERLKVYALLSGTMVWETSEPGIAINVCEDLDWKRSLALHLWYVCSPTNSVSEALWEYDTAFQERKYAAPPIPPYSEDDGSGYDMCYHLLKLYSDTAHPLHSLLAPNTATANPVNYALSWHMSQVLQALDYRHLPEQHSVNLCSTYAAQLEACGLWHWAAFVLLHITNNKQRELLVKELLLRHIALTPEEIDRARESFLIKSLHIPAQWLHFAKAVRARVENLPHEEALNLLKAGRWNESHSVVLKHIAADAIINENFDYLKKRFLLEMSVQDHCQFIQEWDIGGKVLLDYINMMQTLDQLRKGEPSPFELEKLQTEVSSLGRRIEKLPCHNAKDRLAQSEMAKKTAYLMHTLMSMQNSAEVIPTRNLVPEISRLPMPEDYALQELRAQTRSYLLEATMS